MAIRFHNDGKKKRESGEAHLNLNADGTNDTIEGGDAFYNFSASAYGEHEQEAAKNLLIAIDAMAAKLAENRAELVSKIESNELNGQSTQGQYSWE